MCHTHVIVTFVVAKTCSENLRRSGSSAGSSCSDRSDGSSEVSWWNHGTNSPDPLLQSSPGDELEMEDEGSDGLPASWDEARASSHESGVWKTARRSSEAIWWDLGTGACTAHESVSPFPPPCSEVGHVPLDVRND